MQNNPLAAPLMRILRTIVAIKPPLIDAIGTEALLFIDDNFAKQGFQGSTFQPWPKRKSKEKGRTRAILVQTAALRRSITKTDAADHTVISTDIPYAQVHNEGGTITRPTRAIVLSYRRTKGGKLKLARTRTEAQQRQIGAIRRVTAYAHSYRMPQRQFIGESPVLTQKCKAIVIIKITNALPS